MAGFRVSRRKKPVSASWFSRIVEGPSVEGAGERSVRRNGAYYPGNLFFIVIAGRGCNFVPRRSTGPNAAHPRLARYGRSSAQHATLQPAHLQDPVPSVPSRRNSTNPDPHPTLTTVPCRTERIKIDRRLRATTFLSMQQVQPIAMCSAAVYPQAQKNQPQNRKQLCRVQRSTVPMAEVGSPPRAGQRRSGTE